MSRIVVAEYVSLDGVVSEPSWTGPYFNEELGDAQLALLMRSEGLLLGRVTYEGFAAAWPAMRDEQGFADRMNALPKHVATTTRSDLEWNATPLEGDVPTAVAALKARPDHDLLVYGSPTLVDALTSAGLVDEYRLMIFPVVLGAGRRLFGDGVTATLELTESLITTAGVAILTYVPATG
jgi:dihydrofolate reductase